MSAATSGDSAAPLSCTSADCASGVKRWSKVRLTSCAGTSMWMIVGESLVDIRHLRSGHVERGDVDGIDPDLAQGEIEHVVRQGDVVQLDRLGSSGSGGAGDVGTH